MLTPIPGYPLYLATPYGDIHRAGSLGYVKPKRDKSTGTPPCEYSGHLR